MININFNEVTVQDCVDMCEKKGSRAVISDGKLIMFVKEENEDE